MIINIQRIREGSVIKFKYNTDEIRRIIFQEVQILPDRGKHRRKLEIHLHGFDIDKEAPRTYCIKDIDLTSIEILK